VVAAIPEVRLALLDAQRALGRRGGVVMDGRDIGTVVLPNAELKIFLDADLEERARRRAKETGTDVGMVLAEIRERDLRDSSRAVAPLKAADDAIHLDSTRLRIDEVVERVLALVEAGDGEM
jgi:cytidylate kinase